MATYTTVWSSRATIAAIAAAISRAARTRTNLHTCFT
jgi:hypothetical protein